MSTKNLYRLDDLLLRASGFAMLVAVVATFGLFVANGQSADTVVRAYARWAGPLLLAWAAPVVLLVGGLRVRGREKRIVAVWELLRRNAQVHVPSLLANSHFERADLDRAVRLLNTRGLGHYVWDASTDTILDARLQTAQIHVEKCDLCGASISLEVPVGFSEVPRCPYCSDPVSIETLEARRHEAIEKLRAEHAPKAAEAASPMGLPSDFSLPIFLVLFFVFWPAAVVYAWWKWQQAR